MITSRAWAGKRYAVLGLARSGAATVEALLASDASVVTWDADAGKREAILNRHAELVSASIWQASGGQSGLERQRQGLWTLKQVQGDAALVVEDLLTLDLTGFAGVVVSPGVPLNRHPIAAHAAKYGVPVIGDIELFAQGRGELPPHKVVGITGTNGKSTTTALVHHILKIAGVPTTMGGNIGLPILAQEPLPKGGVYVLELSSFQIDLTFTLDCDVAVLLNITPDHLDRYDSFDAYRDAKLRLFEMQSANNYRINLYRHLGLDLGSIGSPLVASDEWAPDQVRGDEDLLRGQSRWPALQGRHNRENALAAIMACRALCLSDEQIDQGLRTYPGLPHRMERIRQRQGVLFVNDSKATNPDSAAPALAAFPAVRWILGGQAKTADLDACRPHFGHVRAAYTIGEAALSYAQLLSPHMPVRECGTLAAAVRQVAEEAEAGDTVLLSPACASSTLR